MRAASFGEGTGARADVTLLRGQRAVLRAARGSRGECAGGHRVHRHGLVQLRVLVGHLDRSGLLGGGSTVAWGRRGDRVRLHVVACARKVTGGRGAIAPTHLAGDVVPSSAGRAHGVRRAAAGRTRRQRRPGQALGGAGRRRSGPMPGQRHLRRGWMDVEIFLCSQPSDKMKSPDCWGSKKRRLLATVPCQAVALTCSPAARRRNVHVEV